MVKLQETTRYRCDTENEATALVERFKNDAAAGCYEVKKTVITQKVKKAKGEIIDVFYHVDLTASYDIEG